jgi:hypothetical protein
MHEVGYSLQCCNLCEHARFYPDLTRPDKRKRPPEWGYCAQHALSLEQPLRIHRSGHCENGFKAHEPSVVEAGLSYFEEFL